MSGSWTDGQVEELLSEVRRLRIALEPTESDLLRQIVCLLDRARGIVPIDQSGAFTNRLSRTLEVLDEARAAIFGLLAEGQVVP